jgi:two-component system chemotaxis response regulator CheB
MTVAPKPRIRVLVVEDSDVVRLLLEGIIAADPRLELAASVASGEAALELLDRVAPDVISMDIRLPGMDGFETTQRIMRRRPTPIVVASASVESEDLKISMNALRAGALSVVEKPVGLTHTDYAAIAGRLCQQLVLMSDVKLVRQWSTPRRLAPARPPPAALPLSTGPQEPKVLGLVASTGGPNALVEVLSGLGADFPLPILLVQHIAPSFLDGFAAWLATTTPFKVQVIREPAVPRRGTVFVAPADRHLVLDGGLARCTEGAPVSGHRPSGTVLLQSLAASAGAGALAVLLTGMGEDGAAGLRQVHEAGGITVAEDESTAVVYGMPAAAVALGAVQHLLPLDRIAGKLRQLTLQQRVLPS